MAAPTKYYVDTVSGNDTTGDGSLSTPWATYQKSLDTITRDATNGDQVVPLDATDDVLSSSLSFATYGTPTDSAPFVLGDETGAVIGGISGNGSVSIVSSTTLDYISFVNMHLHNTGSQPVVLLDNNIVFIRCEIDNTTGNGLDVDNNISAISCYIHNIGGYGIHLDSGYVMFCEFENGTNDFSTAIELGGTSPTCMFNIISVDGASDGIVCHNNVNIRFNRIYSNSGTGTGIDNSVSTRFGMDITNNLVEGFSGTGGIGIFLSGTVSTYGFNEVYNCATNFSITGDVVLDLGANTSLGASPFVDAANGDFDPVANTTIANPQAWSNFTSTDQNIVIGGGVEAGGAGGLLTHPGMTGGTRG